ncbi:MAG: GNAT family N-acetyltransferase [Solirubrobacteraceae bacterium]
MTSPLERTPPSLWEWGCEGYVISNDPKLVDRDAVWRFLRVSYWAAGVTREAVDRAIDNSLVFGMRAPGGAQAGFARAVTDYARMAWIADVFVLPPHRGRGLGVWLAQTVVEHPELRGLRLILATADAHGLYARFGFVAAGTDRMMERPCPDAQKSC